MRDGVLKTLGAAALTVTLLFALAGPAQATDGTFNRAIGFGVNPTGSGGSFEVCTVAANCTVGTNGSAGGQFNDPRDVATDAVGDVYVSDFLNGRVQKFDSSDNLLAVIGSGGGHGGEFDFPAGVSTDAQGNLYVAEEGSNRISKFDSTGHFWLAFGKDVVTGGGTGFEVCTVAASCKVGVQGTLGGELTAPSAVAPDASGNIYVADLGSHRVETFDASGNFLLTFGDDVDSAQAGTGFEICAVAADCKAGVPGDQAGAFNFPRDVATDAAGNVYVSDLENSRVEEFDSSGKLLRVIVSTISSGLRARRRSPPTLQVICASMTPATAGSRSSQTP